MVLLTTTPQILDLIASLPATTLASLKTESPDPIPTNQESPISHRTLLTLSRLARSQSNVQPTSKSQTTTNPTTKTNHDRNHAISYSLNSLLRGTRVFIPPPPPKPKPSPEYVALMARLRADAERRQYQTLVSNQTDNLLKQGLNDKDTSALGEAEGQDQDPITPSLVINIFLSIILSGAAVFIVSRWWSNQAMRVLLSIAAGIVVGIAEVVVYAAYVRNVKRSKVKERRKKERKVMLGTYTGGLDEDVYDGTGAKILIDRNDDVGGGSAGDDGGVAMSVERDVIWGKGKHGGMRRRVRERWEKEQKQQEIDESALDRRKDQ